ncbi:DUF6695 family protein [Saccharicrinis fermentans]|uniref:Type VI secretion system effector TseH-like domain-containing protein n=1 Tax=Saccharicrinis fermentans DSM 9555 = JCM 21142 TaxID=869213 RepID=W7YLR5_9BACT|nr:DUF6695 family protein [Saccharicrinis fermentans]GAF03309.1 hypothetical protein JCM21142_41977 [Saccharicrinis fermentans DSM 9555 = JCM 21142]
MSNHRRVVCLLNGAFVPHVKQVFHTHSRGKVLIDAAKTSLNPEVLFSAESLAYTEPFTLLTIDFGRYHSPSQYGRVRGSITDPDLKVLTVPEISIDGNEILNFTEILKELQQNPSCHGDGKLHASYAPIYFEKAYEKALEMQAMSPMPYGPF